MQHCFGKSLCEVFLSPIGKPYFMEISPEIGKMLNGIESGTDCGARLVSKLVFVVGKLFRINAFIPEKIREHPTC